MAGGEQATGVEGKRKRRPKRRSEIKTHRHRHGENERARSRHTDTDMARTKKREQDTQTQTQREQESEIKPHRHGHGENTRARSRHTDTDTHVTALAAHLPHPLVLGGYLGVPPILRLPHLHPPRPHPLPSPILPPFAGTQNPSGSHLRTVPAQPRPTTLHPIAARLRIQPAPPVATPRPSERPTRRPRPASTLSRDACATHRAGLSRAHPPLFVELLVPLSGPHPTHSSSETQEHSPGEIQACLHASPTAPLVPSTLP